ncbi:MAG: hypothetical protein COW01_06145 [Bdellovibrionales bacterium CG12_big_fil_rev_8_21_14_0_65_38_15]|nr:MAG: hypothetical protein COW79_04040 [Bdellovibrionales bacterium CG22_combo_CG10-13_8_21_14_all_38_13]PIQ56009.1 MAG: hypothetical protein COW01_06145 [Bdellovibrionales bacterium CG12_big_fil_rev_8_21_14_0_65_38_15]PIR30614.1 MAG: hypothetical protein COV38_04685 [Bdellovibrionales bacterium CG11_big_fil_rev_8_21_14_0_20_38_13]
MKPSQRHNFTNISDYDLEVSEQHRHIFSPLLYNRVLRTSELMRRAGYSHGAKSFQKLLNRFKQLELIGIVSENKFVEQFIYPKAKLLHQFRGKAYQKFLLHGDDLDSVRLYWQMAQAFKYLTNLIESTKSETYINNKGQNFDFYFEIAGEKRLRFGMYAYFSSVDEAGYLEKLRDNCRNGYIDLPILFTSTFDENHFRNLTSQMPEVAICHLDKFLMTKEEFLSVKIITHKLTSTLENYVTKEAQYVTGIFDEHKTKSEGNNTIWKSMKEIFK